MQSLDAWLARPIGILPLGSLWVRVFYTECPTLAWGGCDLEGVSRVWLGQLGLHGLQFRVPSCNLAITRLRIGSTLWAWHQSSAVMQVTCRLSPTMSRMCRLQLYTSMGLAGPSKGSLMQGSHSHCSDLVVCAQSLRYTARPRHPWQGICIDVSLPMPCSTAANYSWQCWPPIDDSQHPALLSLAHTLRGYYWYICQRSTHKGTHGISQPQPNWGWEIPVYGCGSGFQPLSNSYWHRL